MVNVVRVWRVPLFCFERCREVIAYVMYLFGGRWTSNFFGFFGSYRCGVHFQPMAD